MHKKSLSTIIGLNIGIIPRKAVSFLLWYHSISIALFTISLQYYIQLLYLYNIRNHTVFLFLDINYKFFPCSGIDLGNSRTKRNAAKVFRFQIVHWMTPHFDRVSPSKYFPSLCFLLDHYLIWWMSFCSKKITERVLRSWGWTFGDCRKPKSSQMRLFTDILQNLFPFSRKEGLELLRIFYCV